MHETSRTRWFANPCLLGFSFNFCPGCIPEASGTTICEPLLGSFFFQLLFRMHSRGERNRDLLLIAWQVFCSTIVPGVCLRRAEPRFVNDCLACFSLSRYFGCIPKASGTRRFVYHRLAVFRLTFVSGVFTSERNHDLLTFFLWSIFLSTVVWGVLPRRAEPRFVNPLLFYFRSALFSGAFPEASGTRFVNLYWAGTTSCRPCHRRRTGAQRPGSLMGGSCAHWKRGSFWTKVTVKNVFCCRARV